jgi:hypothetical protein
VTRPWKIVYQPGPQICGASYGYDPDPSRVVLLDIASGQEVQRIELPTGCGRTFDLSTDGKRLATGYWYRTPGVDVWDTANGERIRSFGPSRVGTVLLDRTSRFVVFHSEKGAWARAVDGDQELRLPPLPGLSEGAFEPNANVLLLPTLRKGLVARVAFDPLSLSLVQLDIPSAIHWLRFSPSADACFLITTDARIHSFDTSLTKPLWTASLRKHGVKGHVYVGTYSGDGCHIGITETLLGAPHFRTIVLAPSSGEVTNRIDGVSCSGYPFTGPLVLDEAGRTLDLASGHVEPGPLSSLLDDLASEPQATSD